MKLSDLVKTVELRIPAEAGGEIVVRLKRELSWFEQISLGEIQDETEQGKFLAWKLIDSWDLTDDLGRPLPVTRETLEKLPASIMLPITDRIVVMSKEANVKKKT